MKRDEIIKVINEIIGQDILELAEKEDELANGVQILGDEKITGIALGVSLNEEFLSEASKRNLNFCIFHHGFDVKTWKSRFPLYAQKRLKLIFENRMTIAGYHFALDVHPEIGNNAVIIRELGAVIQDSFYGGWGFTAGFDKPKDINELENTCRKLFHHDIFSVKSGPEKIKTIAVCSGGAKPYPEHIAEMEAKGVDLFITGETTESAPSKMRESGINYFVCGHYATEVFGIKELGKKLQNKFSNGIKIEFIEIPNTI